MAKTSISQMAAEQEVKAAVKVSVKIKNMMRKVAEIQAQEAALKKNRKMF